jgi:hypothetical protein
MKTKLNWFRKHGEWFMLPMSILLWFIMGFVLRWIDPGAGSHDLGMIQIPVLAAVILFFGVFAVWLVIRVSMHDVYGNLDDYLKHVQTLSEWQRGKYSLLVFAVLLITFALIVIAIA